MLRVRSFSRRRSTSHQRSNRISEKLEREWELDMTMENDAVWDSEECIKRPHGSSLSEAREERQFHIPTTKARPWGSFYLESNPLNTAPEASRTVYYVAGAGEISGAERVGVANLTWAVQPPLWGYRTNEQTGASLCRGPDQNIRNHWATDVPSFHPSRRPSSSCFVCFVLLWTTAWNFLFFFLFFYIYTCGYGTPVCSSFKTQTAARIIYPSANEGPSSRHLCAHRRPAPISVLYVLHYMCAYTTCTVGHNMHTYLNHGVKV